MPIPNSLVEELALSEHSESKGKDIVYTSSDRGYQFAIRSIRISFVDLHYVASEARCDERTGMNEPLVYELSCQGQCSVAMFGSDKR